MQSIIKRTLNCKPIAGCQSFIAAFMIMNLLCVAGLAVLMLSGIWMPPTLEFLPDYLDPRLAVVGVLVFVEGAIVAISAWFTVRHVRRVR